MKNPYKKPIIKNFAWDFEKQENMDSKSGIVWSSFRNDSACAKVSPLAIGKKQRRTIDSKELQQNQNFVDRTK